MNTSILRCGAFAGLVALLFSGCELDNTTPKLTKDITALGDTLKATQQKIDDASKHIADIDTSIKATQKERIDALEQQKLQAAEFVFGANQANTTNTTPNLYTHHVGTELLRAATILGMPTQQSVLDANRRLELLLSQKEQDLALLKATYAEKDKTIATLQVSVETNKTALTKLDQEREQTVTERDGLRATKDKLSTERDDKEKQLIAKEQAARHRAEDNRALKKQMMVYLTIAGVIASLGAAAAFRFYPPVVLPLGVAAAGFFTAAYLVTQITKWELLGILAVAGGAVAIAAYIKHRRTAQIGDNSIGATQELKNRAADGDPAALAAYGELRKHLVDWFGESGHGLEDEIQSRLRSLNLIGKQPIASLVPRLKALAAAKGGAGDGKPGN
jgi:hypothetical protein